MIDFFNDIFEYHHHFNQKLIDQLQEHESALTEGTGALLSHLLNAHQIWNARIDGGDMYGVHEVHELSQCALIDQHNYEKTLEIIPSIPLVRKIEYRNSRGEAFVNSVRDILFHIANHTTHHRGQIIANLRRAGIEPIVTDYIFYRR
jgi:uncharacterized damage-inducible protein DinB